MQWLRQHAGLVDAGLSVALFAAGLLAVEVARDMPGLTTPPPTVTTPLMAAMTFPLLVRRRYPLSALVVVTGAFLGFRWLEVAEGTVSSLALFLALYSAGVHGARLVRDWVRAGCVVASMAFLLWAILRPGGLSAPGVSPLVLALFSISINVVFFVAAWLLGDMSRVRRENEEELIRRADELAAEREERARRAVVEERVRIARELHDVVAHHVSVMGIQAGAARRVLHQDPAAAIEAVAAVEDAGRQAVAELQRVVGILRDGGEDEAVVPQPTLEHLAVLLEQVREAGLPVEIHEVGAPHALPGSVQLSAFRIVQESLTNTLKHAGPVPTRVLLTHTREGLEVEVVDEGRGGPPSLQGNGGRGLMGMRERVAMLGGTMSAGPAPGGGFRVWARLPARPGEWGR